MLSRFEIDNFRVFSHLEIARLGRVNLVIGANNVGKTMLLEALRLYASGGDPSVIYKLLAERNEFYPNVAQDDSPNNRPYPRIESLFFNRELRAGSEGEMCLRSNEDAVTISFTPMQYAGKQHSRSGGNRGKELEGPSPSASSFKEADYLLLDICRETNGSLSFPVDELERRGKFRLPGPRIAEPPFVPATGTDIQEMARQWDAVALRDEEQRVVDCLRIVEPIEKISVVAHPANSGKRIFMVRLPNSPEFVPLKSLGEGMIRMLQIALALEAATNGHEEVDSERTLFGDAEVSTLPRMLLIDEVENGIYHGILPRLWEFIIEGARRFDVQVFATTHSFDCVGAFQAAAAADTESVGVVMRLEKHGDKNKVVLYDEEEISTAVEQGIEVR